MTQKPTHADRVAASLRALQGTTNPILEAFRRSWNGALRDLEEWLDSAERQSFDVDTATHDAAADYLADLRDDLRRAA